MGAPSIVGAKRVLGPKAIPALPQDKKTIEPVVRAPLDAMRTAVHELLGVSGDPLDKAITYRDAQKLRVLTTTGVFEGGGTGVGPAGPPGPPGTGITPDLTPPPNVTGLAAAAGFANIIVTWDAPVYTVGHGHQATNLYVVKKASTDPTLPVFSDAVLFEAETGALTIAALASDLSIRWHIWAKFLSNDGVESSSPAGGLHGVTAQTGKIGNTDLGPLIVEAANLANGVVDVTKLADAAVTQAKLALGSVSADKLVVTGAGPALNADPLFQDPTAWTIAGGSGVFLTGVSAFFGGTTAFRNTTGVSTEIISKPVAIDRSKAYRLEMSAARLAGSAAASYLGVAWYDAAGVFIDSSVALPAGWPANGTFSYFGLVAADPSTTWTRFSIGFGAGEAAAIPANACFAAPVALLDFSATAGTQIAISGVRLSEKSGFDLIVDGAIIASKLAANAIAVGTLAVQNGAIVNAMIGTAAIDDAKIANLSAAKLTVGDGTIGGNLKSSNYVGGSLGWIIRPGGTAEFDFAHIRGTLLAGQVAANFVTAGMIDSRGLTIKDSFGTVIFGAGTGLDWSLVNGANRPSDGATANVTLIGQGASPSVVGNTIAKLTGAVGWDTGAYSKEAYTGGAIASFSAPAVGSTYIMVGLNTDPATDASYTGIDYAMYCEAAGGLYAYESGTSVGLGTYTAGDALAVSYDGSAIRYVQNGTVLRTLAVAAGIKFFLDSSIYQAGTGVSKVQFGPYGNPSAVMPANPITGANASTYIAAAAIGTAQIANAAITNALIGDTIQSPGFVAGVSGWQIKKSTDSAEFQNLTARGNITANNLNAATGTFAGTLSAAALVLAGQVLTQPKAASATGPFIPPVSGNTTIATLASIDVGSTGNIAVMVALDWFATWTSDGTESGTGALEIPTFGIYRNGTQISTWSPSVAGTYVTTRGSKTQIILDTPTVPAVYTFRILSGGGGGCLNATMLALGYTR